MTRTGHPRWCEPTRCSVGTNQRRKGYHRSVAIRSEYDRHSGNSVEVHLWCTDPGDVYIQLEFPGSLREGIELTPAQGTGLAATLNTLLKIDPERNEPSR